MLRTPAVFVFIALFLASPLPAAAQSRRGELRGAWMDCAYGRDWPAIMSSLKDNGFNALFPNFSVGDIAFYPSKSLAAAAGAQPGRDELALAAAAAKAAGIELHVWRINWALWRTSPELLDKLDAAGRLQRNRRGQRGRDDPNVGVDWLCPSNPDNRKLEKEAMLELVRGYDIAGIQFDYMRFPGDDYCFCDHCKEQFQKDAGVQVAHWPDDVQGAGPLAERWRQWRRDLITTLAEEISDEAHRLKPDICVSLAAWPNLDAAPGPYAQDWPSWAREGTLDFVCPMDYTREEPELTALLARQLAATRGEVPLYAGLGAFLLDSSSTLAQQVEAARTAGADGFVAFAYGSGDLEKWLPDLRAGATAADPDPMPHRRPPAGFSFSGPAMAPPAGGGNVIAGAELATEIAIGWPAEGEDEELGAGAPEAEAMLRRWTETRGPITSYEEERLPGSMQEELRLSGRIVVEDPSGRGLMVLGAFDTDTLLRRKARFAAPEGPFRIAIYGMEKTPREQRDFVCRSSLLVGVKEDDLRAEAAHAELVRMSREVCGRAQVQRLSDLSAAFQVEATGPGGGQWWLRLRDGKCESGEGSIADADLTFTASADDLLALAGGEEDPFLLWQAGRLNASGDLTLLRRLWEVFTPR